MEIHLKYFSQHNFSGASQQSSAAEFSLTTEEEAGDIKKQNKNKIK